MARTLRGYTANGGDADYKVIVSIPPIYMVVQWRCHTVARSRPGLRRAVGGMAAVWSSVLLKGRCGSRGSARVERAESKLEQKLSVCE